jgi:hypothetical protein
MAPAHQELGAFLGQFIPRGPYSDGYALIFYSSEGLMLSLPKLVGILSCSFLLCFGVVDAVPAADDMKMGLSGGKDGEADRKGTTLDTQGVHIIQGDVMRVEGGTYFVKGLDGKEMSLRADSTTMKTEKIKVGDRIEAKIDENNFALSLLPAP